MTYIPPWLKTCFRSMADADHTLVIWVNNPFGNASRGQALLLEKITLPVDVYRAGANVI
jgi:hypothetical protein